MSQGIDSISKDDASVVICGPCYLIVLSGKRPSREKSDASAFHCQKRDALPNVFSTSIAVGRKSIPPHEQWGTWFPVACLNQDLVAFRNYFVFVFSWKSIFVKWSHHRIGFIRMIQARSVSQFMSSNTEQVVFSISRNCFLVCPIFRIKMYIAANRTFSGIERVRQSPPSLSIEFVWAVDFNHLRVWSLSHSHHTQLFWSSDHTHSATFQKRHQSVCVFLLSPNSRKSLSLCISIFLFAMDKNVSFLYPDCLALHKSYLFNLKKFIHGAMGLWVQLWVRLGFQPRFQQRWQLWEINRSSLTTRVSSNSIWFVRVVINPWRYSFWEWT